MSLVIFSSGMNYDQKLQFLSIEERGVSLTSATGTTQSLSDPNWRWTVANNQIGVWSPDGQRLAVSAHFAPANSDASLQSGIIVYDLNTNSLRPYTLNGLPDISLSWSVDGRYLAFDGGNFSEELMLIDTSNDAVDLRVLNDVLALNEGEGVYYPAWSPTQPSALSVTRPGEDSWEILLFDVETADTRVLVTGYNFVDRLDYSPDGRYLMYRAPVRADGSIMPGPATLYDMLTGQESPLTTQPLQTDALIWSPDGRYLLSRDSRGTLSILDRENERLKAQSIPVPERGVFMEPVWSPDSSFFVVPVLIGFRCDLYAYEPQHEIWLRVARGRHGVEGGELCHTLPVWR